MAEKLDPRLLEVVERAEAGSADAEAVIGVLVGLNAPLNEKSRKDLISKGLTLRSEIGTVLTGSISVKDVVSVAGSPSVVKLEMSGPLYPEKSGMDEAGE